MSVEFTSTLWIFESFRDFFLRFWGVYLPLFQHRFLSCNCYFHYLALSIDLHLLLALYSLKTTHFHWTYFFGGNAVKVFVLRIVNGDVRIRLPLIKYRFNGETSSHVFTANATWWVTDLHVGTTKGQYTTCWAELTTRNKSGISGRS